MANLKREQNFVSLCKWFQSSFQDYTFWLGGYNFVVVKACTWGKMFLSGKNRGFPNKRKTLVFD